MMPPITAVARRCACSAQRPAARRTSSSAYRTSCPGGGAGPDASPPEKVYFVLAGELTVIIGGKETVLKKNNSCFIGPNENREIVNRGNEMCSILVAIAPAPK